MAMRMPAFVNETDEAPTTWSGSRPTGVRPNWFSSNQRSVSARPPSSQALTCGEMPFQFFFGASAPAGQARTLQVGDGKSARPPYATPIPAHNAIATTKYRFIGNISFHQITKDMRSIASVTDLPENKIPLQASRALSASGSNRWRGVSRDGAIRWNARVPSRACCAGASR